MSAGKENQIVRIKDYWYVETRTGYEGPFDKLSEARKYLLLIEEADFARMGFTGLSLTSQ
jgi:hypothetical protein